MKDNNTMERESLSKEEIIKIKKDADELLSTFGYNPDALNLDIINMKDFYCRGYAKRFKEDKIVIDKLIEALKPLANLDLTGVRGDTVYQRDKTKIMTKDILKAKELLQSLKQIK